MILRGRNVFFGTIGSCVGITPVNDRDLESQGEPFIFHFVLQYHVYRPSVLLKPPISLEGLSLLVGQRFVNRFIRLMSPLFTGDTLFSWLPTVVLAVILLLNLLNCMRVLQSSQLHSSPNCETKALTSHPIYSHTMITIKIAWSPHSWGLKPPSYLGMHTYNSLKVHVNCYS